MAVGFFLGRLNPVRSGFDSPPYLVDEALDAMVCQARLVEEGERQCRGPGAQASC